MLLLGDLVLLVRDGLRLVVGLGLLNPFLSRRAFQERPHLSLDALLVLVRLDAKAFA
jgi:hypothetical protein